MMIDMDSIDLLKKIVSINSVFPKERELAGFVGGILEANGFSVQLQKFGEDRVNVLAERGIKGRPVILYSHLDTVPVYGEWQGDPFTLREDDGKLIGLGAYDMKSGLAAILKSCETKTSRRIKIVFCSDEENDSEGAQEVIKSGFVRKGETLLTTEISDVNNINEPTRGITLGRRGRAEYEILVPGKSCHAAQPEKGVNAITEAAKIITALHKMNNSLPSHEHLPRASQFVRELQGRSTSLSLPDSATIVLDRHMVVPETTEGVLNGLRDTIERLYTDAVLTEIPGKRVIVRIRKRDVPYLMPYVTPQSNAYVQKLSGLIREKTWEPQYNYGYSVADDNLFAMNGLNVIGFGPVGGNEHSADEWVGKTSYLELIDILGRFVTDDHA